MPKKIKFESFKYRFLIESSKCSVIGMPGNKISWNQFVSDLSFIYQEGDIHIEWKIPQQGSILIENNQAQLFTRGDSLKSVTKQHEIGVNNVEDPIKLQNQLYFREILAQVINKAGYQYEKLASDRLDVERDFHDAWAESEDVETIDVRLTNEVCTAPEMRYIRERLGDLSGKRLLDVGCGLGEASVYFAMQGADVTASDLSQGMLDATTKLAQVNHVSVRQHLASAENLQLPINMKYDVIYAGNLLHHVNIEETLLRIKPHLEDGGLFISWDPLEYNPAINIYRRIASEVRTPDEHPLQWRDIQLFRRHFSTVETKYFWLTTLLIFIAMALIQRRDPNKERFWKVILREGGKWAWLYKPLERLDKLILFLLPPLRLLCWNVVIVAKK